MVERLRGVKMKVPKFLAAALTASLVAAPIAAQASGTLPARAASNADGEDIAGVSTVAIVLGLLVLVGVIVLIADDGNNNPTSP